MFLLALYCLRSRLEYMNRSFWGSCFFLRSSRYYPAPSQVGPDLIVIFFSQFYEIFYSQCLAFYRWNQYSKATSLSREKEGFSGYWFRVFVISQEFEIYFINFWYQIFWQRKNATYIPQFRQQNCVYYYSVSFQGKVSLVLQFDIVFHFLYTFYYVISICYFYVIIKINT